MLARLRATAAAGALAALGTVAGARSEPAAVQAQVDKIVGRWTSGS